MRKICGRFTLPLLEGARGTQPVFLVCWVRVLVRMQMQKSTGFAWKGGNLTEISLADVQFHLFAPLALLGYHGPLCLPICGQREQQCLCFLVSTGPVEYLQYPVRAIWPRTGRAVCAFVLRLG